MRDEIEKFFVANKEATGKQIAAKIGCDQVEVAKELNRMRADGAVEREKKHGGGNEYTWWLVKAEKKAPVADTNDAPYTPALTFSDVLREIASESVDTAAPVVAQSPQVVEAKPEVFEVPDFREVDGSVCVLCELLGIDLDQTDTPIKDAIERVKLRAEATGNLLSANEQLQTTITKLRANNGELERRIDELTIVDAEFVPRPLFVTVGRYSPPKRHTTLAKAQRRASQLVRSEKEAEVLVCEPVGRVVRGSEWRSS